MVEDSDEDAWAREAAEEEADRQRKAEPPPAIGGDAFRAWRSPRAVSGGPVPLDNELWHWLVRTRWSAFQANELFSGHTSFEAGPMWCFDRLGKSETLLPNGSVVHIGGEHEDSYDPDFFIYNDVTVIERDGRISIHGYGEEVFPPTDFHTATLVGDSIFIIGRLGHNAARLVGTTPVYRLDLPSLHISRVETRGEAPGWIHAHSAKLGDDGVHIEIEGGERWHGDDHPMTENIDAWTFHTTTAQWTRRTRRDWQHWLVVPLNRRPTRLWETRQEAWTRRNAHHGFASYWHEADEPDLAALERLYRPGEDAPPPEEGARYNVFSMVVDGIRVRFKEERFWVEAVVEGRLADHRLSALQHQTLALVERIAGTPCELLWVAGRAA